MLESRGHLCSSHAPDIISYNALLNALPQDHAEAFSELRNPSKYHENGTRVKDFHRVSSFFRRFSPKKRPKTATSGLARWPSSGRWPRRSTPATAAACWTSTTSRKAPLGRPLPGGCLFGLGRWRFGGFFMVFHWFSSTFRGVLVDFGG